MVGFQLSSSMSTQANMDSDNSRYSNVNLQELVGEIYGLCKDQHGCRYLQKKLEEGDEENIRLIFEETNPHMIELMTGEFAVYISFLRHSLTN
jgi:hypothetical protein